ncbi:MAG TPA: Sec-independent protein translocase protein TatB [Rhizomicrobium sp.]|nr:Sec-independent protein translocase protein TatB [Rhizomicrobium sp.]
MLDFFSWQHLSLMLIVALVVVGPKDLPRLMNMAGKWAGKARSMAQEFRRSFDEMARETELAELRKEIDDLKKNNPLSQAVDSATGVQAEINSAMQGVGEAAAAPAEPRSGELKVTEAAPAPSPPAPAEPAPGASST